MVQIAIPDRPLEVEERPPARRQRLAGHEMVGDLERTARGNGVGGGVVAAYEDRVAERRLQRMRGRRPFRSRRRDRLAELLGRPVRQRKARDRPLERVGQRHARIRSRRAFRSGGCVLPDVVVVARVARTVVALGRVAGHRVPDQMPRRGGQRALLPAFGGHLLEHGAGVGVGRGRPRGVGQQRSADEGRLGGAPSEVQQRRRDVDVSDRHAHPSGRDPGDAHDERNLRLGGIEIEAVLGDAVFAETFAMIAGEDDRRAIPQADGAQMRDQPSEVQVREAHLAVVAVDARRPERRHFGMRLVREVRVVVVDPEEELPVPVGIDECDRVVRDLPRR